MESQLPRRVPQLDAADRHVVLAAKIILPMRSCAVAVEVANLA